MVSDLNLEAVRGADLIAVLSIAELIHTFQTSWGMDKLQHTAIGPIIHSLYRLSSENPSPRYDSVLSNLCLCLRIMGRSYPIAVSLLRVFQLDMLNRGKKLSGEVRNILVDFERNDLQDFDPHEVESLIPVPILPGKPDIGVQSSVESMTMTNFLRLAEKLRIADD